MRPDFMRNLGLDDLLNQIRRIPPGSLSNVGTGIGPIPVTGPRAVTERTRHAWVRHTCLGTCAILEEEMANRRPRDWYRILLQQPYNQRDMPSFPIAHHVGAVAPT